MKRSIWIIRHGERIDDVDENWEKTAKNKYDPTLTENGKQQAFKTGKRLKNESISLIFSSPFLRCLQTAKAVADQINLEINCEQGLSEFINKNWFPSINDIKLELEFFQNQNQFEKINQNYQSFITISNPETIQEMFQRYQNTANKIIQNYQNQNILFVTHGYGISSIVQLFMEEDFISELDYCSICKINESNDGNFEIEFINETSHLN
ncbi:phosphoglycerate mutase family protein [Anaeramoeba ignava]|uniref:Phosphoglycerate mutase family protein n=1 Tax=Anaeramoeba ignava TaxID=1746090 RepID=A0A9Q0RAS3_ANAIG|nr:phosphoglycerate mutase family protein [Anaeramoeba ignava]